MSDRFTDPEIDSADVRAAEPRVGELARPAFTGGVHDPAWARDSCGVAAVARLDNKPRHEVIARGLIALDRLEHRGASGADESTGDGAGILIDLSHDFFRLRAAEAGPARGRAAAARRARRRRLLLPAGAGPRRGARRSALEQLVAADGH